MPSRGIARVYTGHLADTCITSQENELSHGRYSDLVSYTMVEEYGSENEKIVGTVIIIEAIEAETNKKVLIVRANNPQESIIRRIDIEKLVAEQFSAFIKLAKERGRATCFATR